ncbi:MAG TPA: hypothetical protein VFB68_21260 [Xanthobacteraceae bacterium]|nr:hypothetical protein [Xanthobacteraceae bacterium]
MHFIARIACLALALALPAQGWAQDRTPQDVPAKQDGQKRDGQDRVEIDTNLFCDTQQQVERFVSLLDQNGGSAEAAIAAVNDESKTEDACVIATVAYRRAGVAGTAKNNEATFDVTRIEVIGVYTVNGLERSLPTEFFTLMPRAAEDGTVGQGAR